MLTTDQRAHILTRAGIVLPAFPTSNLPEPTRALGEEAATKEEGPHARAQQADAVAHWERQVEQLYVALVAARAARTLRQSQEAEQLDRLRRANTHPDRGDDSTDTDWI